MRSFFYFHALSPLHITHSLVLFDCVPSTSAFQKSSEPIVCLSHMTDGHIPEAYSLQTVLDPILTDVPPAPAQAAPTSVELQFIAASSLPFKKVLVMAF